MSAGESSPPDAPAPAAPGRGGGRLEGRVIAVAGAGGSLGPVVVRALAAEGASVAATDRDADLLASLGDAVAHTATADLVTPDGAVAWRDAVARDLGAVDGLLHLVGGWRGGQALHEAPLEDLDLLERLLFRTVVHTTRAFAGDLRAAGDRGRFALVSAAQAQRPSAGNAAYAAMKAAAEAWTLAFAQELAETGATANAVVINALVTPQMRAEHPEKAYRTFTDAEEIAEALVFLCSDAARKMTGQRLALHGG
jgi:NAD(P)-dependent dehydrogenase (short-subunit alcohol dehydrogenase family)